MGGQGVNVSSQSGLDGWGGAGAAGRGECGRVGPGDGARSSYKI